MAKYQKTGILNHYAAHAPTYGDCLPIDYVEALDLVAKAETMFSELPSSIRDRFENDPEKFLAFVQDPKNTEEAIKLGLAQPLPLSDNKTDKPKPKPASADSESSDSPKPKDD